MPRLRMTAKSVESIPLPPPGERTRLDYWDEDVRELVLRVSAGRKVWAVSYFDQERRRQRVTLGPYGRPPSGLGLADAREKARETLAQARVGMDPARELRERKAARSFGDLAADYLEHWARKKKSPKHAREDERRIDKVLLPRWKGRKAGEIRRGDVVELLDEIERERGPISRNRLAALLSKIFNFAIDRDLYGVERNPALRLADRDLENVRKRPLSDDELRRVLPLFREQGAVGLGFYLIALTGCRPVEVFGARWSEFDLDAGLWRIPRERLKQRRSRYCPEHHAVPLSAQARKVVNELRSYDLGTGYVFPSRIGRPGGKSKRDPVPYLAWAAEARAVRSQSGIDDWELYDLRSTVATGLEHLRFAPHVVSAVLCHILDSVTGQHYQRGTYDVDKAEALAAWGEHLASLDPSLSSGEGAKVVEIRKRVRA